MKDKIKTSALSVADGGKNVIISETHTVDGVTETIAAQLTIDYNSRTVAVRPVGNNWVNDENYIITADTVARIKKQAAIMVEISTLVEDALANIVTIAPEVIAE